jgi:lipopolysaccharide export system permease protein
MRIFTTYLLKAHVGPFAFALTVLTSLLLVNTVARKLEDLVGKGLPWSVLFEFLLLSIPHIVALTLPMAVLVSVLYAFSQLTADNEVTALKASGVNLLRLLVPLLGVATILALIMVWFNDSVLPESNHRLKNLITDIARKSPTLQLKEQTVNEIQTGDMRTRYFLQAARIDPATNVLNDVVIYDLSNTTRARTVYGDRGDMAFNEERTDLFLTLHDGWVHEVDNQTPERFQRVFYDDYFIRVRGVGNQLERSGDEYRSDREMSLLQLSAEVDKGKEELATIQRESADQSTSLMKKVLTGGTVLPKPPSAGGIPPEDIPGSEELLGDELARQAALDARVMKGRTEAIQDRVNEFAAEYHKKFAIPFACLVFVLIGAPIAVRFPRGGVGMVISISLTIFGVYYVSLIGGESLSDKGFVKPFWGMWAANILFLTMSAWGIIRIGHESSTSRGGGWEDLLYSIRSLFERRRAARESAAR